MRVVEYDASRRGDVAALMSRVWGDRPHESELEWFYEQNPVRAASVLLGEEDGKVVATTAIGFQRMLVGGEELEVGMPVRLATDPDYRRRGIFSELEAANEERARDLGVRLLLTVPNAASGAILLGRLGWTALHPVRVWARLRLLHGETHARLVARFASGRAAIQDSDDRVLRDAAWLNWRFAASPRDYTLLSGDGYAAVGHRGRLGVVAVVEGALVQDVAAATPEHVLIAAPPPSASRSYLNAGYLPTPRTFTVLGKSLGHPLPERPHFELGDLDFL